MEQSKKCFKCWWIEKYGIDFLKNYGLITEESIIKFLNIEHQSFKTNYEYFRLRKLLECNDL